MTSNHLTKDNIDEFAKFEVAPRNLTLTPSVAHTSV